LTMKLCAVLGEEMGDKILFVDDEPAVLDGYKRTLYREFEIDTAVGGEQGLQVIESHGPYAVVVSDMRMPGMDGVQFLSQVRQTAPNTVRMILSGQSDMDATIAAVNEGNIFRFLTKPCDKDALGKAVTTGLIQYRLITAEKDLLENTLMGCIKVLTDVLSTVSPEAFGKSMRIARCMRHLVAKLKLPSPWSFEAAAMLSKLGCITLDTTVLQAAYLGIPLSPDEQTTFNAHPQVARDLIASVPRLEPIAWMISQQLKKVPDAPQVSSTSNGDMPLGAKMLALAVAFDDLRLKGNSSEEAIAELRLRREFDRKLVDALVDMKEEGKHMELRKVPISKLSTGMILQQEVRHRNGLLVVGKGQEVTHALLMRLENFARSRLIDNEVMVSVPV
ncbi:MAG TPA: HD domain-containing phosphohydrolase, partial [Terriglobales bacterium]|nr:HD domain-containing phosphohydrolase [Terriglobales bacterium]